MCTVPRPSPFLPEPASRSLLCGPLLLALILTFSPIAGAQEEKLQAMLEEAHSNYVQGLDDLDARLLDTAIRKLDRAKDLYLDLQFELPAKSEAPLLERLGSIFYNLGKAWHKKHYLDRALNYYQQSERLLRSVDAHAELGDLYLSIGILHENVGTDDSYRQARLMYDKVQKQFDLHGTGTKPRQMLLALNRGRLFDQLHDYDSALAEYLRAESLLEQPWQRGASTLYGNIAAMYSLKGQPDAALDYANRAIDLNEKAFRKSFAAAGAEALELVESRLSPYWIAAAVLFDKGMHTESYEVFRMTRGRVFELERRLRDLRGKSQRFDSLWERRSSLEQRISELGEAMLGTVSDRDRIDMVNERDAARSELTEVTRQMFRIPHVWDSILVNSRPSVQTLQAELAPGEAVVEYFLFGKQAGGSVGIEVLAFVVTANKVNGRMLATGQSGVDLHASIRRMAELLRPATLSRYEKEEGGRARYLREARSLGSSLYRALVAPLEPEFRGADRLYVIPAGYMTQIPFEALVAADGRMLLQQPITLSYLTSLSDLRPPPGTSSSGTLIYGDIRYGKWNGVGEKWSGIPMSSTIVDKIRAAVADDAPVTYRNEARATETLFKSESSGHGVVVIWSHGSYRRFYAPQPGKGMEIDASGGRRFTSAEAIEAYSEYEFRKAFSDELANAFIVFADVNKGGDGQNNGYLTAREAMNLDLTGTRLTILAACETGLGAMSPSEGMMGLKRAFHFAGSRNLLTSLWRVEAGWTGELIRRMLGHLEQHGAAAALRRAKLELIGLLEKAGKVPTPYWSGFVLTGRGT